ncbi:hypothetical protein CFOL_v3_17906 [Cephalotus follicularis]|uniref:Uncharacterized protein n=1 Tax=Cephalotus follicularis TaxID=3775 RepID=A0A1Q3C2I7_CEPFO|nr:hypothetical protein CFOL_v3_17906 [Cephalotus follicularis]
MKTLIFVNLINLTNPRFSHPNFPLNFRSLSRGNRKLNHISRTNFLHNPKALNLYLLKANSASDSTSYVGWDELGSGNESFNSGLLTQLRNFLASIGIDDKKYIFVFLLGIICALAISRIRISSLLVFPASVLVFALGFSFGFLRGRVFNENGSKRRLKEETFMVSSDKLRTSVDFLDGIAVKVGFITSDIQRAVDCNRITFSDLESYVNGIESIRSSALNAKNVVESVIVGNSNGLIFENQKSSRKRKEVDEAGFDLLLFVASLFGQKVVISKPSKVRDNVKQGSGDSLANDQTQANISSSSIDGRTSGSVHSNKANVNTSYCNELSNKAVSNLDGDRRVNIGSEDEKMSLGEIGGSDKRFIDGKEYRYQNNSSRIMNKHHISSKINRDYLTESWESDRNLLDSLGSSVSFKQMESEASFVEEQMLNRADGVYSFSHSTENIRNETYMSRFREERLCTYDDSPLADHHSTRENEVGSFSSSAVSDDVVFDRYLTEANDLLKQAKECIRGKHDEKRAEILLYKSGKLLSQAIAMKPMSFLAVGQLGNTYLLHGELKLKTSRELRAVLSGCDPLSVEEQGTILSGLNDGVSSKDEVASVLVNVCEECEELLVEAGRKYRLALSIDGNDVRALYNWGLALTFRAQLIAEIGPEAAFDADKVFLAAIDKFDAMMSKGNGYAPDALLRWGVALQQRSRLRPSNSKEKVKLLQQAKRLYEDALNMDSKNVQVRKALSSCISELNYWHF